VLRGRVSRDEGDDEAREEELQTRIVPSGKVLPVARRSGFQGHQAKAYQGVNIDCIHQNIRTAPSLVRDASSSSHECPRPKAASQLFYPKHKHSPDHPH